MTRNQNFDYRETSAKIIYKNSMNTLNTSKTYSGASQLYTRSLLLQLKRNLPKDKYYKENDTAKRDLSIETDICILRRYYKNRRNRFFNREAMSAKSKYSMNQIEIDTIDEFKRDNSACGDSEQNVNPANKNFNINLTSLVMDNLKDLLNDWIKTYLLEKNETRQKFDTVLDSILHKLELQTKEDDTSSSCTYTVDIEVARRNRNQKTDSQSNPLKNVTLQTTKPSEETSILSIPLKGKYLRIISTLSLPHHAQKTKRNRNSRHNMKRIRHKKILLSISKSSNYIFQSSDLDFLTLPTKSLTKHCVTYDHDANIKVKKFIIPKSSSDTNDSIVDSNCKERTYDQTTRTTQANKTCSNSNTAKSFYDNIYTDTSHVNCSHRINNEAEKEIDSNKKHKDKCKSANEEDQSDPLITIDLLTQSFESNNKSNHSLKVSHRSKNLKSKCKGSNKCKKNVNVTKLQHFRNINTKQYTYLFRKSNNLNQQKTLLKHFQSILKYFSSWEGKKDIKVDIQVNVFPLQDNKKDDYIDTDKNKNKTARPDILLYTEDKKVKLENTVEHDVSPGDKQNIISLLDGAASQAKYIISRETSTHMTETDNKSENEKKSLDAKHSKITQEINELKIIIKSLATTAEKLANDNLHKQTLPKVTLHNSIDASNKKGPAMKTVNTCISDIIKPSKSIQFSNSPKSGMMSGIKIKKGPKHKNPNNFNPRLVKKNTSYNIIDSESILRVTDMTSAAQGCTEEILDEALMCSLPISKSLFEVSIGPDKKKLLAFYCDDLVTPEEKMYNICHHNNPYCSVSRGNGCQSVKPFCIVSKCNHETCCNYEPEFTSTNDEYELCDNSSSSICIDIDGKSLDKKLTISHNIGMGFWEGCLYCLVLWIPLLVVSYLFYIHVLQDVLKPKHSLLRRLSLPGRFKANVPTTDFPISLADLGF